MGQLLFEPFLGTFWGCLDFFDPLKKSLEMAQKVIVLQKTNYVPQFLKQLYFNSYFIWKQTGDESIAESCLQTSIPRAQGIFHTGDINNNITVYYRLQAASLMVFTMIFYCYYSTVPANYSYKYQTKILKISNYYKQKWFNNISLERPTLKK